MRYEVPKRYRDWVRLGTSSWKYDSWKGLVYDNARAYRPDDYLADYARYFKTVEVDQWFWSLFPGGIKLPDKEAVKKYIEAVPEDFKFTVKAPNAITLTHYYARQGPKYRAFANQPNPNFLSAELLKKFLKLLAPLKEKLGPIMFQFEYLNRQKMASREAFQDALGPFLEGAPAGYSYAVEVRNPHWLTGEFFEFLAKLRVGFVYLEGYYMPPIAEVFERYRPETADFSVIRLQGSDREGMEKKTGEVWNGIITPKPESLEAAAAIVRHNRGRKVWSYVNFNNHFEGSAPLSAARFIELLTQETS